MQHIKKEMTSPTLRPLGERAIDLLCRYYDNVSNLSVPVMPNFRRGEAASNFSEEPPEEPKMHDFDKVLVDVEKKIVPYLGHWQHPHFMAFYPASTSIPAILGDTLAAGLNPVGLQWSASPISTELEVVVMDWIASMIKLPQDSPFRHRTALGGGGLIQNTAGDAIFAAVAAAKFKKQKELAQLGDNMSEDEREDLFCADSSKLVAYISDQAHFSSKKATRLNNLRTRVVPAVWYKGNYVMRAETVTAAMNEDRAKGLIPCVVLLNYGTTNTCACDDVGEYREIAKDVWVHLDAAYAGAAWVLPDHPTPALNICNSFNFNGSKWFLCGFDSAFLFVKNRNWFKDVFSATGVFMDQSDTDQTVFDPEFKDWSVPLGRRFRALRVWLVLEYYGARGVREFVQKGIDQADFLRRKIDEHALLEQTVASNLGLVVAHAKAGDEVTSALSAHLIANGYLVYTSNIAGVVVLRFALGGQLMEMEHVRAMWDEADKFLQR